MTAPTLVAHGIKSYSTANSTTTTGITTTGAAKLLVAVLDQAAGTPTITDSKGNTYEVLRATEQVSANPGYLTLYQSTGTPTVGTAHTFTTTHTAGYATIQVWAIAPAAGETISITTTGTSDSASPFTSAFTTTENALLLAVAAPYSSQSNVPTWSNSFTATDAITTASARQMASASRTVTTSAAYRSSVTFTNNPSTVWTDLIALTGAATPTASVRRWTGAAWATSPLKYWNGAAWIQPSAIKVWNGAAWVTQ